MPRQALDGRNTQGSGGGSGRQVQYVQTVGGRRFRPWTAYTYAHRTRYADKARSQSLNFALTFWAPPSSSGCARTTPRVLAAPPLPPRAVRPPRPPLRVLIACCSAEARRRMKNGNLFSREAHFPAGRKLGTRSGRRKMPGEHFAFCSGADNIGGGENYLSYYAGLSLCYAEPRDPTGGFGRSG